MKTEKLELIVFSIITGLLFGAVLYCSLVYGISNTGSFEF